MADSIIIYNDTAAAFLQQETRLVAKGFEFAEGPVWHPDGFLLFSDIPANRMMRVDTGGTAGVFMENSGFSGNGKEHLSHMTGSNGTVIDRRGNLLFCQHGNHAISRLDTDGNLASLVDEFDGRPFNSPNDLVLRSDNVLYFTDPPYGLKNEMLLPHLFQPHAGIYRFSQGQCTLLTTQLRYPNGVCLSPDEKLLYASSNHPDEPYILRFELDGEGNVTAQTILLQQSSDGMTTDAAGHLFLCTEKGLMIVSPEGQRLALIPFADVPTNVCWGGATGDDLYITARSSVFCIPGVRGLLKREVAAGKTAGHPS